MSNPKTHGRSEGWRFVDGLIFIGAIVVLKFAAELHPVVREWEARNITALQERLHPHEDAHQLAVVVFDISGIARVRQPGGAGARITDRATLIALLEALAAYKPAPRAIAIDVDFSDSDGRAFDPVNDKMLFDKADAIKKAGGPPVYFGVGRQAFANPGKFLPENASDEMAGGMILGSVCWRMPVSSAPKGGQEPLLGLGERLGRCLTPDSARPGALESQSFWEQCAGEFADAHCAQGGHVIERTIDLSQLAGVRDSRIVVVEGEEAAAVASAGQRLAGKLVLIGNGIALDEYDRVRLPGFSEHDLAGIYFHACAAITPSLGGLSELTHFGRLLADVGIAVVVLGVVALVSLLRNYGKAAGARHEHPVHWLVTVLAAILIWIFGYLLVPFTRVLWIDYYLVAIALVLHRPFELAVDALASFFSRLLKPEENAAGS